MRPRMVVAIRDYEDFPQNSIVLTDVATDDLKTIAAYLGKNVMLVKWEEEDFTE